MSKKEDFRDFVKNKPELASYIKSGEMTWQKFYELYDLYGDDNSVWKKYDRSNFNINEIIRNVDVDSIKEHINTAQKALDFVQELTSKTSSPSTIKPTELKPLNKFFED